MERTTRPAKRLIAITIAPALIEQLIRWLRDNSAAVLK
jgi:hypothetical protein